MPSSRSSSEEHRADYEAVEELSFEHGLARTGVEEELELLEH